MLSITPEQRAAARTQTNTLMALSQIAFSSIERLTTLNLNLARATLEDGFTATRTLVGIKDVHDLKKLQNDIVGPAAEKVTAYVHEVQEIATQSQEQAGQVLTSYFAALGMAPTASAGWTAGFDMLNKLAAQTNSMVEANIKAVGDTTAKMAHPLSHHPKKAA